MRILVTGGAGFIGSNLAMTLQARYPQASLVVLDDFSNGNFANLAGFRGDVVTADMAVRGSLDALGGREFDAIYHLAANTDTRVSDQPRMMRQNVEAFRNLLDFSRARRVPIVYASSAATYGRREGRMKESDEALPANVYAFSKLVMDNIAREETERHGGTWKLVGVRYFNVYGPHEGHKGVPSSMAYHLSNQMVKGERPRIFEFGEQTRDFVHVDDAVNGTIHAMERSKQSGVYNIGSGKGRSFNELIAALNKALGTSLEPEYIDNPYKAFYQNHTEADLTRSNADLGYAPKLDLEAGVASYMKWLHPDFKPPAQRGRATAVKGSGSTRAKAAHPVRRQSTRASTPRA